MITDCATRRVLSPTDRAILAWDRALRTLLTPATSARPDPGLSAPEAELDENDRRLSAALMRINHTGEVCAQALYQGQALTARNPEIASVLEDAAREESDHLAWTENRISELGGQTSVLNPVFYAGSFLLGIVSGLAGDRWNLGFLAETERQVEGHLAEHLSRLPETDTRSRAILEQMRSDERNHAETAVIHGGVPLPGVFRRAMRAASRLMTGATFRI